MMNPYDFLNSTYIFENLPKEAIALLAKEAKILHLSSGEYLIRQNEIGDNVYVLCHGRLNVFHESGDSSRLIGEIYPRETVGEMALLGEKKRSSSVIAARHSIVLVLSIATFERVIHSYPVIGFKLAQLIVTRTQKSMRNATQNKIIKTIAIIPASNSPELIGVAERFEKYLAQNKRVFRVTYDLVTDSGFESSKQQSEKLIHFFFKYELNYDFIIYDCQESDANWRDLCINQADCVLIFDDDKASQHDFILNKLGFPRANFLVPIYLVCVHPSYSSVEINPIHRSITKVNHITFSEPKTLERLARLIMGYSIGLLLGGGGARGYAHIGVIRALEEYNISIDVIAGVSSGSIIAALYAMGLSGSEIFNVCKKASPIAHKTMKYPSFPIISIYNNKKFIRYLKDFFKELRIENLWLNYFAISCDLSLQTLYAHERGLLRDAIYASNAVVPMFTPAVQNGHVYVDGGFINSVPGDIIRERCNGIIIGVDVAREEDLFVNANWQEYPSNSEVLMNVINPFGKKLNAPGMFDLLMRSMSLGRNIHIKNTRKLFDHYLTPPLEHYKFLDYLKIDEIEEIGYRYTVEKIKGWQL